MSEIATTAPNVSILRLRFGILLLLLWWLPVYLLLPTIDTLLDLQTARDKEIVLITILLAQTIIGFVGIILTGKELAHTLRQVKYKKMPRTIWNMAIHGQTDIDESYLKPPKKATSSSADKV